MKLGLGHLVLWVLLSKPSIACDEAAGSGDGLTVTTATGVYTGILNPDYASVREFRSIPFAEPPLANLRWKPPVALGASKTHHYSYRYPASCPQFLLKTLNLFSTNITNYQINTWGQDHHDGSSAQAGSEDCLSLAIWTPSNVSASAKLPVAFFLHGGSFVQGGVEVPYELPAGWIDRSQQHIVVSANYRMNVFGFPNAAGLDQQNVGVLDARLALEWTYANIAAFGGDPQRIMLWGQSAGAVLADFLSFAWWEDPIASSLFLQSGNAIREVSSGDNALQSNFTFVAKNLGCDFPTDPEAELDCMQHVPADLISNFIGTYYDNKTEPSLYFRPTVDEKILFTNYSDRANAGYIAKIPALETTTANEEASLIAYPKNVVTGPNQTAVDGITLSTFVCPAFYSRNLRAANNLTTYRYQYAGNFTNVTPFWWMGAYHASDVPPIFGTYNISGGATDFEVQVAEKMQDYVLAFLKDPENGLRNLGWQPDDASTEGTMIRFAAGDVLEETIQSSDVDDACIGLAKYNSRPS